MTLVVLSFGRSDEFNPMKGGTEDECRKASRQVAPPRQEIPPLCGFAVFFLSFYPIQELAEVLLKSFLLLTQQPLLVTTFNEVDCC